MKFIPQRYAIPDAPMKPFIDVQEIENYLQSEQNDEAHVNDIIKKSLDKQRLSLPDVATLLNVSNPDTINLIKNAAQTLKERIYGNRVVLFAPLYVGNYCINDCTYCGFRSSNKETVRVTLSDEHLIREVEALENDGQKRLILVFGEHAAYSPEFIANTVRKVYAVKKGNGEIRRVNINAAPLDIDGFRTVKNAGIGTYQIFQETYHPDMYQIYHQKGQKKDYIKRLAALDCALEAGLDDVGIGALFGLYDWRFEVMALVRHVNHLEACYNVGPHTISFPRLQAASHVDTDKKYVVPDEAFTRLVAILRLAVPYTGLICTAREKKYVRHEALRCGVSQIDGGTKLELGGYSDFHGKTQDLNREQFQINDERTLSDIIDKLLDDGFIPSFCTACYRKKRTGEHFMEFSVPGFIKHFCTPNALLTLAEYLDDYATEPLRKKGYALIKKTAETISDETLCADIHSRLQRITNGERDIYY